MARHIIDPGRESTTIILLSEKKILNQLLLIYHHRHRSRHLSSFIKEASVCSRWLPTQRTTTGQCTENETKMMFLLKWNIYIISSLPKAQGLLRKRGQKQLKTQRWWMTLWKWYILDRGGQLHTGTHSRHDSMQTTTKSSANHTQTKSHGEGNWTENFTPTQGTIDNC